jgi:hypothetical protein
MKTKNKDTTRFVWKKTISKKKRRAFIDVVSKSFECTDTKDALLLSHKKGETGHIWVYMIVGAWNKMES